jgi:hypothetical protein
MSKDNFTEHDIQTEMKRIHQLRQDDWDYKKQHLAGYQGMNVPTPYVPASDEVRREEAIEKLRANQARIAYEAKQDTDMWFSRFGLREGGYRKSRRSRTLKRVQKRKQTRRHRHRHRR